MSFQDFQGFGRFLRGMHPAMSPDTTLQGEHWRIGLITESLIRLEWSDSGEFEDRATLMAVDRAFLPSGAVDYGTQRGNRFPRAVYPVGAGAGVRDCLWCGGAV